MPRPLMQPDPNAPWADFAEVLTELMAMHEIRQETLVLWAQNHPLPRGTRAFDDRSLRALRSGVRKPTHVHLWSLSQAVKDCTGMENDSTFAFLNAAVKRAYPDRSAVLLHDPGDADQETVQEAKECAEGFETLVFSRLSGLPLEHACALRGLAATGGLTGSERAYGLACAMTDPQGDYLWWVKESLGTPAAAQALTQFLGAPERTWSLRAADALCDPMFAAYRATAEEWVRNVLSGLLTEADWRWTEGLLTALRAGRREVRGIAVLNPRRGLTREQQRMLLLEWRLDARFVPPLSLFES